MSLSTSDSTPPLNNAPLVSTLASDPDMAELIEFFVGEIGDRIQTLQTTSGSDDVVGLRTIAHQLKGAGAGYGFTSISNAAGELERLIDVTEPPAVTQDILSQVDDLIDLCRRVSM